MTWNIGKNEHMKGFSDENGGKAIVSPFPANQGIFAQLILKNCKKIIPPFAKIKTTLLSLSPLTQKSTRNVRFV